MSDGLEALKRRSTGGKDLKRFVDAAASLPFLLGVQKRSRLKLAGCAKSGTLLHNDVAKRHAEKMLSEYKRLTQRSDYDASRLRDVTVLYEVCELDERKIISFCENMISSVTSDLKRSKVAWGLGAAEVELVNLDLLARINEQTEDEKRKFNVLCDMAPKVYRANGLVDNEASFSGVKALVHCHVLVDMGDDQEAAELRLRKQLARYTHRYQTEVKTTFSEQPLDKKLQAIAAYNTKSGNEELRFKAKFRRDVLEDLEAIMWRKGLGRKDRGEYDLVTTEDVRGLSALHVAFLDRVYGALMRLEKNKTGYKITYNECRNYAL